jgi:hypothetical protein
MSGLQILGVGIIASVFLAVFVASVVTVGFWEALGVWLVALALAGAIILGVFLAVGGG